MLAVATIIGRAGRDAETKYREDGSATNSFSVAVSSSRKLHDKWVEETDWYRVFAFGKAGEGVKKGDLVAVSGALRVRMTTGKDGKQYLNADINAGTVRVLERAQREIATRGDDPDKDIEF